MRPYKRDHHHNTATYVSGGCGAQKTDLGRMDPILITVLRDVLGVEISPLTNNVAAALSMVLYFKIAIEAVTWFRLRYSTSLYSKQLLHITLASSIIFWSLFDDSHWSWRLNTLLPSVMMARYIYKVRDCKPKTYTCISTCRY